MLCGQEQVTELWFPHPSKGENSTYVLGLCEDTKITYKAPAQHLT